MIHVATAELLSAYKSAFSGVGMSGGEADDAARIAIWLDACGFDAITCMARTLDQRSRNKPPRPTVSGEGGSSRRVDCGGASILEIGAALVDYAIAEHRRSGIGEVCISNVADGGFVIGLASTFLSRGVDAVVERTTENSASESLTVVNGKVSWSRTGDDVCEPELIDFIIRLGDIGGWRGHTAGRFQELVPERRQGHLVSEESWNALLRFANLMLVPESEASRAAGAGIGADED